jgi:3-oxoacyl-[acyl-carrier protein] reductase
MELGIAGKKAIVCAASKGLGRGCAESLAREGVDVTICARSEGPLNETAEAIRALGGGAVTAIACDITSEAGRQAVLDACPDPDILVNNAGGPPPGNFRDWDRDDWIRAVDANMLTPIFLIKATVDGMIERKFGRIVNITSGAVKSPIDILGLSNGARAGLTGFVAGIARSNFKAHAEKEGISVEEAKAKRAAQNPAGRFGTSEEFGDMCAFICSAQAGFMTGQNFLMDGGAFRGTL